MGLNIQFINDLQRNAFYVTKRNLCISGGYGNGKTTAACLKGTFLLGTFPKYRLAILRKTNSDLKRTTMSTFFKYCPPELYDESRGGKRADSLNYLRLVNGSEVFWLHLDQYDEGTVRGLEINSAIIDQAEEIDENIYLHLDSRIGRWDQAELPPHFPPELFPPNPATGKPVVPSYMMILCNPDSELHWIYRRYHPASQEWREKYSATHEMIEASSRDNPALTEEYLTTLESRDQVFVDRYVIGKWGIAGGQIHTVHEDSILNHENYRDLDSFIHTIQHKGALFRILDHGDAAPTCCLWTSAYKDWIFIYREYYQDHMLISEHRKNISDLSVLPDGRREPYTGNYADPSIFKKTSQKYGGFWSVADEYLDTKLEAPALSWAPADNNEFFTRNRVSELLRKSEKIKHPITGESPAPRLYFIQRSPQYPHGCFYAINETKAQKRKQITTINGKPVYSDERDKTPDHAYDCVRYFAGIKAISPGEPQRIAGPNSFYDVRKQVIARRLLGKQQIAWASPSVRTL